MDNRKLRNQTVSNAASIMRDKINSNDIILEQFNHLENKDRCEVLKETNRRLQEAIKVMQEFEGCFSF